MFLPLFILSGYFFHSIHAQGFSTNTSTKCVTKYGSTSVSSTNTVSKTATSTKNTLVTYLTTHTTATVTPKPIIANVTDTITITTTSTDLEFTDTLTVTETSTFSTTSTESDTTTITVPSTTVTTITSTSIIPTSAGFLPVDDTTGQAYPHKKRAINHPHAPNDKRALLKRAKSGIVNAIPTAVTCTTILKVTPILIITVSGKPIKSTLPPSTKSKTTTTTSTSTSVYAPHATVTITTTTTSTDLTTSTAWITTSTTSIETDTSTSTVTSYAACATNNLLGTSLSTGNTIDNVLDAGISHGASYGSDPSTDPYDCCVACILSNTCTGSAFWVNKGKCILLNEGDGVCGPQSATSGLYESEPGTPANSFIVSNGNCGFLYDGGLGQ